MGFPPRSLTLGIFAALLLLNACTHSSSHGNSGSSLTFDEEQQDLIRQIRGQQQESPAGNPAIQTDLATTPQISVQKYISSHGGLNGLNQEYQIGGQDVLSIMVHEEKDLSRDAVTVAADGTITFPFIGRIDVGGKTPAQIEEIIARRLSSEGFLVNPHVSVQVASFRSKNVVVLGAVNTPGRYSLESQETLLDILSRAGGVNFSTGSNRATIMRSETGKDGSKKRLAITLNIKRLFSGEDSFANLPLQNNDVVFIPTAEKVYVMGEVMKPGEYVIEDNDATVIEAIGMAGGFTRIAAPNRTSIVRTENGQEKVMTIPVEDITSTGHSSNDITLRDKDIIIVPESYF